jgi:regulation of enolase protein 1 (concanavalin A-like superfamily)
MQSTQEEVDGEKSTTHITISFSYAYLNGLDRLIVSSDWVVTAVHRPKRAISPRMTISECQLLHLYGFDQLTVHEHCLGDIVRIMPSDDMVDT